MERGETTNVYGSFWNSESHGMLEQVGKSVAGRGFRGAARAGDSLGYLGDVIATVKGHLSC